MSSPLAYGPLAPHERIATLDVLRGFALLGILMMNIEGLAGPLALTTTGIDPHWRGADRVVDTLIYVLVQGKFYSLFSLLFGMGFAVMSTRAEMAGRAFAGVYWRRGLVLLGIGLAHALLIWAGDILTSYALVCFLLLAFRQVSPRWQALSGIGAYAAGLGMILLSGLFFTAMSATPELRAELDRMMAGQQLEPMVQAQRAAYGHGGYWAAVLQRAQDSWMQWQGLMVFGPMLFGLFLIGSALLGSGAMSQPERHGRLFAGLRWIAMPLGLAAVLLSCALGTYFDPGRFALREAVAMALFSVGGAAMALGFLGWIVWLMQRPAGARGLGWLAPAGRMALSNYLMQSVVCTLIFYGYGAGRFEQLPRAWQPLFVLGLFLLQVWISTLWLRAFRFGPMEWLWRSLTYLQWQPLRRRAHAAH
jgi:uncharacterized protein